jgi:hypothetical protein
MSVLFKGSNRRNRVAVFNAGRIGAKKTRPFLNVTLAQLLGDAQLTQLWGRLHQLWWKLTIEFQPLDDPLHFRSTSTYPR